MSYISHAGTWLTDEAGRVVQMHGLRVNYIKEPPYMEAISDEDMAFLVSEGLNAMRVNWIWEHAEPEPGVYNEEYLDHLVTLNDRLAKFGIRSLVGMAHSSYSSKQGGLGAPPWAVVSRYFGKKKTLMDYYAEERGPQAGGAGAYAKRQEEEQEAWDNFYADALAPDDVGVMTHCINTWKQLASRLESKPNVFALDLFHEPPPGYEYEVLHGEVKYFTEPVLFEMRKLWKFHRKFINEVREADKKHILFYQGSCYHDSELYANCKVNIPANFSDDKNIGFSSHITSHDSAKLPPEKFRSNLNKALDNQWGHAAESDIAFVVSGFRNTLIPSVYANFVDTLAARSIPWTYFTFRGVQAGPTNQELSLLLDSSKPAALDNVKDDMWDAIVVPYAQLTAGTPVSWDFDRETKVMEYTYSTAPTGETPIAKGAFTEIFIPARHYPNGYSVEVTGAAVRSHETSAWVVLENDENAKEVKVTVHPRSGSYTERASWGFGPTSAKN